MKDPVIDPPLMLQVGAGVPAKSSAGADVKVHEKSCPGKPTPLTVTLLFGGASVGDRKMVGAVAEETVKLAEALSPSDPFTVTT